jgi:anti-sigma regulatory factor (Ser/Thr protein kinase)
VTAARLALSDIDEHVDESTAFDIRLLVSELVTNSVRHAQLGPEDSIRLKVEIGEQQVRVEVSDPGPGFDPPADEPTPEQAAASGWGIFFVKQLADRWGVERDRSCVWFEVAREGDEQDSRSQTAA